MSVVVIAGKTGSLLKSDVALDVVEQLVFVKIVVIITQTRDEAKRVYDQNDGLSL